MKLKLSLGALLLVTGISYSQEVELEKDKVYLDGKEILKYEKITAEQYSFYSLEDEELLLFKYSDNETREYKDDDYIILNFLTEKKKIESTDEFKAIAGLGLNSKKNMKKLITWLLKEKALGADGKINPEKLEVFGQKYHEDITVRTVR
ncbi:MAG: hypothetical protein EOO46_09615 [Flavobacterium sp.]|nr:MAG: hypothetical protein EOO46_09615 [Flavobacterium sp.]